MRRTLPQLLLVLLTCVGPAGAQIAMPDGVALSPFPVSLTPAAYQTFADGDGGVWAVFQEAQPGSGLYAQHINQDGGYSPGFSAAARLLAKSGTQVNSMWSAPDGVGGAVIIWFGSNPKDTASKVVALRLLRFDAQGDRPPSYPDTGIVVSSIAQAAMVVGDGLGGCYVAWKELKNVSNPDIVAQHYDASGVPLWTPLGSPSGRNVCAVVGLQDLRAIQSDGAGGAYVVWADSRVQSSVPLYAMRLLPSGVAGAPWTTNGVRISSITAGIRIVGSGASPTGGLWLAWRDNGVPSQFTGQHVDANANFVWGASGALVATVMPAQAEFVAASSGDAFVTWGGNDIRCSRISAAGARVWSETSGRVLVTPITGTTNTRAVSDGAGGLRLAWSFDNAAQTDVNMVRATGGGSLWPGAPALGDTFATTPAAEEPVAWFLANTSTPLLAWLRDGVLRVRRIASGETLGVGPGGPRSPIELAPPAPNPSRGGSLALRFSAPHGPARLDLFDAAGRRVLTRALFANGGTETLRLDEAARLAPGVYTLRLGAAGRTATQRLVRIE